MGVWESEGRAFEIVRASDDVRDGMGFYVYPGETIGGRTTTVTGCTEWTY